MTIKLLVADDQEIIRVGLRSLLAGTDITIVGDAASGTAAGILFSWVLIKSQFFADCADKTNWPKDGPGLCTLSNPPWFGGVFYAPCSI